MNISAVVLTYTHPILVHYHSILWWQFGGEIKINDAIFKNNEKGFLAVVVERIFYQIFMKSAF